MASDYSHLGQQVAFCVALSATASTKLRLTLARLQGDFLPDMESYPTRRLLLTLSACLPVVLACGANAQRLPKPDANNAYYRWSPAQQLVGHRAMDWIFPALVVRRGRAVSSLPRGATPQALPGPRTPS